MNAHVHRTPRVLGLDELRHLLAALLTSAGTDAALAALVTLTGQRAGNIAAMNWNEIDVGRREWRMPRTKSAARTLPIPATAFSVLLTASNGVRSEGRVLAGERGLLDPTKSRSRLDRGLPTDLTGWSYHGLRRSIFVGMAVAGLSTEIIAEIAGHRSLAREDPRWVRRTLRDALDAWARALAISKD